MRRNIGRDKGRRGIRKERDGDSKKYDNEILKEEVRGTIQCGGHKERRLISLLLMLVSIQHNKAKESIFEENKVQGKLGI